MISLKNSFYSVLSALFYICLWAFIIYTSSLIYQLTNSPIDQLADWPIKLVLIQVFSCQFIMFYVIASSDLSERGNLGIKLKI